MLLRYASSTTVEQVFIGSAPAYICVACSLPFLYPSRGTERWQRAVRAGVINDPDAVAFLSSISVRKCSLSGGTDSNGVALGTCSLCYAHVLPSGQGRGQECHWRIILEGARAWGTSTRCLLQGGGKRGQLVHSGCLGTAPAPIPIQLLGGVLGETPFEVTSTTVWACWAQGHKSRHWFER